MSAPPPTHPPQRFRKHLLRPGFFDAQHPESSPRLPKLNAAEDPPPRRRSHPSLTTQKPKAQHGRQQQQQQHAAADISSYTVDERDNHAHGNPGGTEEEANRDRINIERRNRDALLKHEFWNVHTWRVASRHAVPEQLLSSQEHHDENQLPFLERAISECHDPNLENFACLIESYERQFALSSASSSSSPTTCSRVYGAGLIKRFRSQKHDMCSSSSNKRSSSSSTVTCFSDRIQQDHTIDTAVCGATRIGVGYDNMQDGDFPWLQFLPGALQAKCDVRADAKQNYWHFMHCLRDWMDLGFQSLSPNSRSFDCSSSAADSGADDDPLTTFFVTRSGDYSPFALAHDWLNTVIVFAVANISRSNVRINIMDRMTTGFYSAMWSLAFSPGRALRWFPDLRREHRGKSGVCYRKAWFNIPARLSPLYNNDGCGHSPVVRFTSDLLVSSVGAGAVSSPRDCFVTVLIVRRNYQTGHSIERRIPNWRALAKALRSNLFVQRDHGADGDGDDGVTCNVVHAIDYADFDFDQQLNISRSADLLVGMHGAGLIQSMFLPPHAGLFEFFCPDRPPSNNRYENLARRLGLRYASYNIEDTANTVPVDVAVREIRRLALAVAKAKRKWRRTA